MNATTTILPSARRLLEVVQRDRPVLRPGHVTIPVPDGRPKLRIVRQRLSAAGARSTSSVMELLAGIDREARTERAVFAVVAFAALVAISLGFASTLAFTRHWMDFAALVRALIA